MASARSEAAEKAQSDAAISAKPRAHHAAVFPNSGPPEKWEVEKFSDPLAYVYGYGNDMSSEALEGALPKLGNTPMRCPYNLYAEQVSGTSFTTPRVHNKKTWVYKIRPSAAHVPFRPVEIKEEKDGTRSGKFSRFTNDFTGANGQANPNQLRWKPFPIPSLERDGSVDFLEGIITLGGAGDPATKQGFAIHVYGCNDSMRNKAFFNSDGDLLIVPQVTTLVVQTEMGKLRVAAGEFCIIPRGIKFAIALDAPDGRAPSRGYICEVYDSHFVLPDLGPIGANGLANPRHFAAPSAAYENRAFPTAEGESFTAFNKFLGRLFSAPLESSPFDVVAWTGNYVPFKYDMAMFNTVNSVSFDHLDPSIFTVLTAQTHAVGVAAVDFVVFPPRFAVQEDTFRPPYYHRNCMTEFMGNIMGQYDAKPEGFVPGSASLHSCMMGHGPDAATYKRFSNTETAPAGPVRMNKNDLAFMFESTYLMRLTAWANDAANQQTEYHKCWLPLEREFDPTAKPRDA